MPAGLTPEQQAYAREVFAELLTKHPNQTELGNLLKIDQSRVSAIRATGKTSMQVLLRAAVLAGRPNEEIARIADVSPVRVESANTRLALDDLRNIYGRLVARHAGTDDLAETEAAELAPHPVVRERAKKAK